jgi:hypothetical protein
LKTSRCNEGEKNLGLIAANTNPVLKVHNIGRKADV